jgi:hypothetical protein
MQMQMQIRCVIHDSLPGLADFVVYATKRSMIQVGRSAPFQVTFFTFVQSGVITIARTML